MDLSMSAKMLRSDVRSYTKSMSWHRDHIGNENTFSHQIASNPFSPKIANDAPSCFVVFKTSLLIGIISSGI